MDNRVKRSEKSTMSLSPPQRNYALPSQIQRLLNNMYAGPISSMSGLQILAFFRRYSDSIEQYRRDKNWRPTRSSVGLMTTIAHTAASYTATRTREHRLP